LKDNFPTRRTFSDNFPTFQSLGKTIFATTPLKTFDAVRKNTVGLTFTGPLCMRKNTTVLILVRIELNATNWRHAWS